MARAFDSGRVWVGLLLAFGGLMLAGAASGSEKEQLTPAALREKADQLDRHALKALELTIKDTSLPAAAAVEMAKSFRQEADLREQAQKRLDEANKLQNALKAEESHKERLEGEKLLTQADGLAAVREEEQHLRDREHGFRHDLLISLERANVHRLEGRHAEAAAIEAEVEDKLRQARHDRDFERTRELKRMAVEARLDNRHENADLYEREAARLLQSFQQRSSAAASSVTAETSGESPTAEPSQENREEVRSLRADVERLAEQVQQLTAAVDSLRKQIEQP